MNESIRILFTQAGRELSVDTLPDGILLFGETSAWPRRTAFTLRPISPGTKAEVAKVRMRHDLGPKEFRVTIQGTESGHVLLGGLDSRGLPHGSWELAVNLYPFGSYRAGRIQIPEDGQAVVTVPLGAEPGSIAVRDVQEWDSEIVRVLGASGLDHPLSGELERENGISWVGNDTRRGRRRACALNVLAVCRELDLIPHLRLIFFVEVDRIYAAVEPSFLSQLDSIRFRAEGAPSHPIHERIFELLEVDRPRWEQLSFRQNRSPSLQAVVTRERPESAGPGSPVFAELDIDRANPGLDLLGFFVHTGEVVHPGRTNHIRLREKLAALPAERFLVYDAIQA
jgi:hypothetical protein